MNTDNRSTHRASLYSRDSQSRTCRAFVLFIFFAVVFCLLLAIGILKTIPVL